MHCDLYSPLYLSPSPSLSLSLSLSLSHLSVLQFTPVSWSLHTSTVSWKSQGKLPVLNEQVMYKLYQRLHVIAISCTHVRLDLYTCKCTAITGQFFLDYLVCVAVIISLQVADFNPDLSSYFAKACSNSSMSNSHPGFPSPLDSTHSSSARGRGFGVPFQEATDNSRNFPSMKAFHAFKKQRWHSDSGLFKI